MFYASMFHLHYPFVSRLPFVIIRCNKRPVTMSVTNPSGESSKPVQSSERNADRRAAEPLSGSRFTEEEMAIHNLHKQACQVTSSTSGNFLQAWLITNRRVDCCFNKWRDIRIIPIIDESYYSPNRSNTGQKYRGSEFHTTEFKTVLTSVIYLLIWREQMCNNLYKVACRHQWA